MVLSAYTLVLVFALAAAALPQGNEVEREEKTFFDNMFFNRRKPDVEDKSCSCTCGEKNEGSRIVNGTPADAHEFPWIVRLSYFNRFYCGGMLINDRYVLTAAHCVKGFMWFMIKVTFGEHDRCDTSSKPETRFVLRATPGDFSYLNFDNDIAILRLNDRVPISETIRPICLPAKTDYKYVGEQAIALGWGTLEEDGKPACILQEVTLPVMSNEDCKKTNYSSKMISDNMMCAGYLEGKKDSCQGDSGGPLIRQRPDKRFELIGVVSWGNGCARPGYPGIYTRVTRYVDWIRTNTLGGCWCQDPVSSVNEVSSSEYTSKKPSSSNEGTTKKPSASSDDATKKPSASSDDATKKPSASSDDATKKPSASSDDATKKPSASSDDATKKPASSSEKPDTTEKYEETTTGNKTKGH